MSTVNKILPSPFDEILACSPSMQNLLGENNSLFICFDSEKFGQMSALLVNLAVAEASRKCTMRHRDWEMIYSHPMIFFEDHVAKYM